MDLVLYKRYDIYIPRLFYNYSQAQQHYLRSPICELYFLLTSVAVTLALAVQEGGERVSTPYLLDGCRDTDKVS